ncbi:MAG TPA: hypothetical protein VMV71_02650 [Candidatus Paceibacterota bacterium]|nr:hypothetical protein [Candidatus Paceibacterota bacterium]
MGDWKTENHNKGQDDAANGHPYSPPWVENEIFPDNAVANEKYREGYENVTGSDPAESKCFLTTACVEHAGLADNCRELTVLRSFRDNYVAHLACGPAMLAEYCEVAPAIVQKIGQSAERDAVLAGIFDTVKKAVELIEREKFQEAFACYKTMFADLKKHY